MSTSCCVSFWIKHKDVPLINLWIDRFNLNVTQSRRLGQRQQISIEFVDPRLYTKFLNITTIIEGPYF